MSIQTKRVPIITDSDGDDVTTIRAGGVRILGIRVEVGTLDEPDITITSEPDGTTILGLTGVTEDATYQPTVEGSNDAGAAVSGTALPVAVFDRIMVTTANGGDTLTGEVTFLLER